MKPIKKKDKELFDLLEKSIKERDYVFKKHAKKRQEDRVITEIDVLDILEGKLKRNRHRNKKKDKYEKNRQDWNYCIEGKDLDGQSIRIILSFEGELIFIITVIRIEL